MQSLLLVGALAGTLMLAPGGFALPSLAQVSDPSAGLELKPERYQTVIGQPPAAGSLAEVEDLAILRWNQRTRYPEQVLHSWRFLSRNLNAFNAAVGSDLTKIAPTMAHGLLLFLKQIEGLKDQLKNAVARPRPFVSHPDLVACLPIEDTWSYPSGHATWYAAASLLLADLLPERRERLLRVGEQGAYARTACGLHYPSDVLAAQRLAERVSQDVIGTPQWRAFKQRIGAERTKLLLPPPAGLLLLTD